jgi:Flp pilus assembly pilin Flp
MNKETTVAHGRTAQKHRIRGLAVLAVVLSTAVIATVDTTSALDAEVSTELSASGRHVRSTPRQHVEASAAGGRMILR